MKSRRLLSRSFQGSPRSAAFIQALETFQQQSAAALDMYWGWTSKLVNDQMERLTALAAVFLPLTFWTGFFGTNFQLIPYDSKKFFYLCMAVMVSTVFAFYMIIQKGGYFGRVARRRRADRLARKATSSNPVKG